MHLTHDVWYQVVKYFEHEAQDKDAPWKRAVLVNLAVTSRMLSGLALAALWKDMGYLRPIVDVINCFTPVQEYPLLTWVQEDTHGYWIMRRPNQDQIDLRVKEYLDRIRVLCVWKENEEERALWPILIAWFWKNEPLLPKLQELIVHFTDSSSTLYQYLAFMVPHKPHLISTNGTERSEHLITFYQLLHSRGCSPTEVEYIGDLRLPPTLTFFKGMRVLYVSGPYMHVKHGSQYSLVQLLQQLPSLSFLEVDLQAFKNQTTNPPDPFEHLSLETLILQATTEDLNPFLSFDMICPLVKLFSLKIRCDTNLSWEFLLNRVTSIFPNLCDLTIEVVEIADTSQLVFSDLAKLQSQPMRSLILDGVPNNLTQENLHQLLGAWPGLHTLTLTGGKTPFDADVLLISTLIYRNLHTLRLPLSLIPLVSPLACNSATQKSPLKYLRVATPTQLPSTLKEKVVVAQNLLILLPELENVKIDDKELGTGATDLQDIINGMQTVIAARSS